MNTTCIFRRSVTSVLTLICAGGGLLLLEQTPASQRHRPHRPARSEGDYHVVLPHSDCDAAARTLALNSDRGADGNASGLEAAAVLASPVVHCTPEDAGFVVIRSISTALVGTSDRPNGRGPPVSSLL